MIEDILLAFIPIFVAIDPLGMLPVFVHLTHDLKEKERKKITDQSMFTAFLVALLFIFLGKAVFEFLGITVGDFMIAGGIILFCLSILDLIQSGEYKQVISKEIGVVPIGTPLVMGPGALTTCLIIRDKFGIEITLICLTLTIVMTWIVFRCSGFFIKILGPAGSRALSKIMALLLAAFAIMMIRKGIVSFLS